MEINFKGIFLTYFIDEMHRTKQLPQGHTITSNEVRGVQEGKRKGGHKRD